MNWIEKIEKIDKNYFNDLKNCSHAMSETEQNPYHLEHNGNVFGHVKDVYNESIKRFPNDEILQLAALLHDIAKPFCRFEEDGKVKFFNHESMGVFLAVDILNKLGIFEVDKVRVLEIIQRHADSYKFSTKNIKKLYNAESFADVLKIRECDMYGRIAKEGNRKDVEAYNKVKDLELNELPAIKNIKGTCAMLIGPPGSGKSKYLENFNGIVISRDDCLMQDHEDENYSDVWNNTDQNEVDKLFETRLKNVIDAGLDFVIDMTNMNVKSRRRFIERLKHKYNVKAVVFLNPLDVIIDRNAKRNNKCLDKGIIYSMCKKFQMPYDGEGFQEILYKF